jgi:cell division protease FtsH
MKKLFLLVSCFLLATTNSVKPAEEFQENNPFTKILSYISASDYLKNTAITVQNALIYSALTYFAIKKGGEYLIEEFFTEADFTIYQPGEIKESFDSIAGYDREKELFKDIIEYLKDPKKYELFGAEPHKGILLTGAPGTGKTLLVRALAGEANCAFIYACSSDFNSGPSRIKKIFEQAKEQEKACIIFLDEFELIAPSRERSNDPMLITLLTELDGFVKDQKFPIIVIAATNYPDKLDPAVVRPGRISHKIHMQRPDLADRKAILQLYLSKIEHEADMNLSSITQRTEGLTAADLADIVQSGARIAINNNQTIVTLENLEEALDIQQIGVISKRPHSLEGKKITAYHEAGHALISILIRPTYKVTKITIVPRASTGGVTEIIELDEDVVKYQSKEDALNMIAMAFGGRAAEEIIFNLTSTGPASDLKKATQIAEAMIKNCGMGNNLMVALEEDSIDKTTLNNEINEILNVQYQRTIKLLKDNFDKLHKLAEALLEKETLYSDEIYELVK